MFNKLPCKIVQIVHNTFELISLFYECVNLIINLLDSEQSIKIYKCKLVYNIML